MILDFWNFREGPVKKHPVQHRDDMGEQTFKANDIFSSIETRKLLSAREDSAMYLTLCTSKQSRKPPFPGLNTNANTNTDSLYKQTIAQTTLSRSSWASIWAQCICLIFGCHFPAWTYLSIYKKWSSDRQQNFCLKIRGADPTTFKHGTLAASSPKMAQRFRLASR